MIPMSLWNLLIGRRKRSWINFRPKDLWRMLTGANLRLMIVLEAATRYVPLGVVGLQSTRVLGLTVRSALLNYMEPLWVWVRRFEKLVERPSLNR